LTLAEYPLNFIERFPKIFDPQQFDEFKQFIDKTAGYCCEYLLSTCWKSREGMSSKGLRLRMLIT